MGYRIGSFNLRNLGLTAMGASNARNLRTIANIINGEQFDIVALQEILSQGKAFTSPDYAKRSILMELGPGWEFQWADAENENDPRHEGYAFVWRKNKLRMCSTKVMTRFGEVERTFYPRICKVNREDMIRRPYYGRFTANGIMGGTNVEFRLICVHTYHGQSDNAADREIRHHEIDVMLKDIYPQITDRRYGVPMAAYTILLGDYNAELWTKESSGWQEKLKLERGGKRPAVMRTDENGIMYSERYKGRAVKTVQDQLTTLKSKITTSEDEEFDTAGFSYNYDHFSYEEDKFAGVDIHVKRITSAVTKYCKPNGGDYNSDFEKYYKTVSDHIPIMMEIELK